MIGGGGGVAFVAGEEEEEVIVRTEGERESGGDVSDPRDETDI